MPDSPKGFWSSCRVLLRYKRRLALAFTGAVVAAASFGAGIGMILPGSYLVLEQGKSLRAMLDEHLLASDHGVIRWLGQTIEPIVPVDPFQGFVLIIVASFVLSIVSIAGQLLHGTTVIRLLHRVLRDQQNDLFARVLDAPPTSLWQRGPHEFITRLTADLNIVVSGYTLVLGKGVQKILTGLVALLMAIYLNWQLTIFTFIVAPLILLIMRWVGKRLRERFNELQEQRSRLHGRLHHTLSHFDLLKLYAAERFERRAFHHLTRDIEDRKARMLHIGVMAGPVTELLTVLAFGLVAAAAGWLVLRNGESPLQLLAVLALLGVVGRSLQVVVGMQQQINVADRAWQRVREILDLPGESASDRHRPLLPPHRESVTYEGITFTYNPSSRPAVNDITLSVPFGAYVAIVGANGSGKTTLMSLLCRLMEPTSGRVLIDGRDIAHYRVRSIREQVAMVPQHGVIIDGTVHDNIVYGMSHVGRAEVIAAATVARAHGFIVNMKQDYDTRIGPQGVRLSGGEKQRICLARALLRKPTVLVLDEATSQVDGDSEQKINEALLDIRAGRTTFVIAHRLATVLSADSIFVMDHGKLIDHGTHEELLDRCEIYRQLTHTQLKVGRSRREEPQALAKP